MSHKNKKSSKQFFSKKKLAITLFVFVVPLLLLFGISYLDTFQTYNQKQSSDKSTQELMDKMKKMLDAEKNRLASKPLISSEIPKVPYAKLPPKKEVQKLDIKVQNDDHLSEIKDYKNSLSSEEKKSKPLIPKKEKKFYPSTGKPKLAIIIDDVAFEHQTRAIKKIPFKVTPSFFPPTTRHPDTKELSKSFSFAMVHLPLEASNYATPEPNTLLRNNSSINIEQRILQIKKDFPHVSFYNNHTGSTYTEDFDAMDRLISILRVQNITFIDSRTTAKTKVPEVFEKYGMKLYSRDIFLDNDIDKSLIQEQLLKAVKLAKKNGYAIAIGHPHTNTLEVLQKAKPILEGITLVYVKDL
ncbi:MAG: divergent polysaccharide deacetylase family protein [Sulfurospirillum sp.]|nr:divergent polysaccharide deacetylase family protein [Sulfurospirillum sp.]